MAESAHADSSSDSENNDANGSTTKLNEAKVPAPKDKQCPYCHQPFTSSSLGRHLDQFISKKKPDGIHNVDEIRRMRGGITRRTARGGGAAAEKKGLNNDLSAEREDTASRRASPSVAPSNAPVVATNAEELNRVPPGGLHMRLNRLNWQATGVITDPTSLDSPGLPAPPTPALVSSPSTTMTSNLNQPQVQAQGTKRSFATYSSDMNSPETTRALELSLREVLDSLRAATKNASPKPSPFNFDVHSQTFPSLCLKILPTPPTLFQAAPFGTANSIPITAPGPEQLHPLRQQITQSIDLWKWQTLRLSQPTTSNIAEEADFLTRSAAQWTESTLLHLDAAFQNWMANPLDIRTLLWHVELLRAYHTEQTRVAELEESLETVRQEAAHLQQQVDYLSKCQWPREMALWPPERRTWGKEMREELRLISLTKLPANNNSNDNNAHPSHNTGDGMSEQDSSNTALRNINVDRANLGPPVDKWDFDRLVNKWKNRIKEDRLRKIPLSTSSAPGLGNPGQGGSGENPKYGEFTKPHPDSAGPGMTNGSGPTSATTTGLNGVNQAEEDARRATALRQRGNISIISDF
ncbi:hypothetical protein PV10_05465 [Exophiala mesophila]|uniref:Uncharacterized protein n=1 Tax=Exophiala mesophila TaxID=212818 RepID=A0A0D1ZA37_EXOME|nr:uncharacterized protein PV10_05465 [Exophiala mesophila]KIV90859.1 hypothetical protein PV10_05465 [Exophiala mesophila]